MHTVKSVFLRVATENTTEMVAEVVLVYAHFYMFV
jgi:hypothetical protein